MKKNLLIKLNDIIVDISTQYDKSIKKSIEFFLGRLIDVNEIEEFRRKICPVNNTECINKFINEQGLFLRDVAIIKKFNEYYTGREFEGYIKDTDFLIDKTTLKKISDNKSISLLLVMPKEEADFILKELKINNLKTITAKTIEEGIKKAKESLKEFAYIGNTDFDKDAAKKQEIDFIKIEKIKDIKDLL